MEVAMERFEIAPGASLEISAVGEANSNTAIDRLPVRVVELGGDDDTEIGWPLGVDAIFREVSTTHECGNAIRGAEIELDVDVVVVDGGSRVDGPTKCISAFRLRHDVVTVRVEIRSFSGDAELVPRIRGEEVDLVRRAARDRRADLNRTAFRGCCDDIDDAAERIVSVHTGVCALNHLHALDAGQRNAGPVNPATKGIVERYVVNQNQASACSAWPHTAQGHALGCGVSGETAGPSKETEGRDLAQNVVRDNCRGLLNLIGPQNRRAGRHVPNHLLCPGDNVDSLFVKARELQFDLERRGG